MEHGIRRARYGEMKTEYRAGIGEGCNFLDEKCKDFSNNGCSQRKRA